MISWQTVAVGLLVAMALWYLKSMAENFARGQNDKLVAAFQDQLQRQRDADRHSLEVTLAAVQAEHSRLTNESQLYVTHQHTAYAEVYRLLHQSHDEYLQIFDRTAFVPDISKFTPEELDESLRKDDVRTAKRQEILALWTPETWRQALHILEQHGPIHNYGRAGRFLQSATNAYLGNLLYFSDEASAAVQTLLREIAKYDWKVMHGIQRVADSDLKAAQTALRTQLQEVHRIMRGELRRLAASGGQQDRGVANTGDGAA